MNIEDLSPPPGGCSILQSPTFSSLGLHFGFIYLLLYQGVQANTVLGWLSWFQFCFMHWSFNTLMSFLQSFGIFRLRQRVCHLPVIYSKLQQGEEKINTFFKEKWVSITRKREKFTLSSESRDAKSHLYFLHFLFPYFFLILTGCHICSTKSGLNTIIFLYTAQ